MMARRRVCTPRSSARSARGRRPWRYVLIAASLAVTFVGAVAPALAHDQLLDTSPAAGSVLPQSPTVVTLTFSGDLLAVGMQATVTAENGTTVAEGEPAITGTQMSQHVQPHLPDGRYTVRWRVVSGDGHPISDQFEFTVSRAASSPAATTSAQPSPAASASSHAAGPPSPAFTAPTADRASSASPAGHGASPGRSVLVAVTGAVLGLGIYAIGAALTRRRRAHDNQRAHDSLHPPGKEPNP